MKQGLLILLGESFRTGSQGTRVSGLPCSYEGQRKACMSHVEWMKNVEDTHKVQMDVVISTYETPYTSCMYEWYGTKCIDKHVHQHVIGWNNLYFHAVNKWCHLFDDYEFVHFMRIDLELKPVFSTMFVMDDKLRYPSVCFTLNKCHVTRDGHPRVSDMMLYVPKKHCGLLETKARLLDHEGWSQAVIQGLRYEDIDVYIKTYHDSDSAKDLNPMYRIVNRDECEIWRSEGEVFDASSWAGSNPRTTTR